MPANAQRIVLLDRDGVINRRIVNGYVTKWRDFTFLPGVPEALRVLKENGYTVLVVSNQTCVGRGLLGWEELQAITRRMQLEVALAGGALAQVYYSTHAPGDGCDCRKPQPGLLLRALEEHYAWPAQVHMVGDSESDVEAALRAGCRSVRIRRGASLQANECPCASGNVVGDLGEAVELILRRDTPTFEETLLHGWPMLPNAGHVAEQNSKPTKRTPA